MRNILNTFIAMAAAVLLSTAAAQAQSGGWTTKTPLGAGPRNEVALAAVGDRLFVIGGNIGGNAVPLVDEYNPGTDTWRPRAPMPRGLDHLGVAVVTGRIF